VLPASDESNTIANISTFLGNLGLLLKPPNTNSTTVVKVSAQDHSITVGDEYVVINGKPVTVMVSTGHDITVSIDAKECDKLKDESAWLYVKTDIGFGMKIRFYKKHLEFMITENEGLTTEADGLMGMLIFGKHVGCTLQ